MFYFEKIPLTVTNYLPEFFPAFEDFPVAHKMELELHLTLHSRELHLLSAVYTGTLRSVLVASNWRKHTSPAYKRPLLPIPLVLPELIVADGMEQWGWGYLLGIMGTIFIYDKKL